MSLVEDAVYTVLLPVTLPFHWMMVRGLSKAQAAAADRPPVDEILARDETTLGVPTPRYIPADLEADYLKHRSAAYVDVMVLGSAREFARMVAGKSTVEQVSDADVARAFMASPPAMLIRRTDADDAWLIDCDFLRQWPWFEPEQFEVVAFEFDVDRDHFRIRDIAGKEYAPGDAHWASARRKLVAQMSLWTTLGHNWTHFWFSDVIAATAYQRIPEDTILYKLLAPHVRFTSRHNNAGLWVQRATDNEPGFSKRLVPWLIIPMQAEPLRGVLAGGAMSFHAGHDIFHFTETADRRIPYFDFLARYHEVVERFVDRLFPSLEAKALAAWQGEVCKWFEGACSVEPRRLLSTAIWLVGVAHAVEHLSYVEWAKRFGHADVETPITAEGGGKPKAYNRYRFLAFLNSFLDFQAPTTGLDLRLVTSDQAYGFEPGSDAAKAAAQFVSELKVLDEALRAEGKCILPLDLLIRCICF